MHLAAAIIIAIMHYSKQWNAENLLCIFVYPIMIIRFKSEADGILDSNFHKSCTFHRGGDLLRNTCVINTAASCNLVTCIRLPYHVHLPHLSPQMLTLPLAVSSKISQIRALYKIKSKGAVSTVTWAAVTYGCAGKVREEP